MDSRDRIDRARRVQHLLDNDDLSSAFESLEARYLREWRDTHITQDEIRTQLWHRIKVLDDVRTELQAMLQDGDVELHLEQSKKRKINIQW